MAYNRKNLLLKILDIQTITLEQTQKGVKQNWIYEHYIKEKYRISTGTYQSYLAVNAKKELKELERAKNETK